MKNQILSQEKSNKDYKENVKKYNQDSLASSKVSGQANKQQNKEAKNLLAVVKLDIGDGQQDEIRYYQGDDIIQVVSNFCQQYELEEKCIAHIVANIKQQINKAQSKEMNNRIQKQQREIAMLEQQQQSIQSNEKEDIQSQSTNTSSKQNYFQFNHLSPGQGYSDQYSQNSTKQSKMNEKPFFKKGMEQNKMGDYKEYKEKELDFEYYSDYNQQEFQQIQQFKQSQELNLKAVKKTLNSQIDIEHQRKKGETTRMCQERNKSRNTKYEDESPKTKDNFISGQYLQGYHNQQEFMGRQSFIKNDESQMQENYEKWHKYTELKKNLNTKSREDLPNQNKNSLTIINAQDDKRIRSQSYLSVTNSQNISRKNTLHDVEYNNCSDEGYLDEHQILEKIRNEGLLPNNLTKSQIKTMIITNGSNRISPKKNKTNQLNVGNHCQKAAFSSSFVESKSNKNNKQLSNIEEIQNSSASNNTSRFENTYINNSLKSSFAPNISAYINTQSNSFVQSNTNLNTTRNEDFSKKNKNIQRTPTRNSKKSEEQISPLQNRNSSQSNISQQSQKQNVQPQQSQQKKIQGINIPILDIKKAQAENSYVSLSKQYPQTSRSPTASTHREQPKEDDDFQKYLRGNQTEREQSQKGNFTSKKQGEELMINQKANYNSQQFSKILLSDKVRQQSNHHQNSQKQKDSSQKDFNGSINNTENNSFMRSSQNQNSEFNQILQSDNILKIDLESYKRQKKVLTNPSLTDRPKNKEEVYHEGFKQQQIGQHNNASQNKQLGQTDRNQGSVNQQQKEKQRSPMRDINSYIQEYDMNNKHKTQFTQENSFLDQQLDKSVVSNIINSSRSPATSTQQKTDQMQSSKGIYSNPSIIVKQQMQQKQKIEQINSNEPLVNRLLRQKEQTKVSEQQQQQVNTQQQVSQKQSQKRIEVTQNNEQQYQNQNSQQSSNNKYDDFTQFLHQKIFTKMDNDGDGYVSVIDVEINTLKTDILEIIQNFLIELADNSSIQYSFSQFVDFVNNNKSILDSLKQIYTKKYNTNSSQLKSCLKQTPKSQQLIQQQQQQQEQVQQTEAQKQSFSQPQLFCTQQPQINQFQLPSFANIQQKQDNNTQNWKIKTKIDQIQQKQQISEIEEKDQDAPISHFIDVTKHLKNKKQDPSQFNQQQQSKQQSLIDNNHPITYGNHPSVQAIQQNEMINFSFSEDIQNRQLKFINRQNQIYPPYLNNTSPKDLNNSSYNHSPSFEQSKPQIIFGNSNNPVENKKNDNNQIQQDLLISFSNQSIPYHEPSFGPKNVQSQPYSSFKGNTNEIKQQQQQSGSINPPQIISGRYKNLVQKKFNHSQNQN